MDSPRGITFPQYLAMAIRPDLAGLAHTEQWKLYHALEQGAEGEAKRVNAIKTMGKLPKESPSMGERTKR